MEVLDSDPSPAPYGEVSVLLALLAETPSGRGVHTSPRLPPKMVDAAAPLLAGLGADEAILAVVGRPDGAGPPVDCVLTSTGLWFPGTTKVRLQDGSTAVSRAVMIPYGHLPDGTVAKGGPVPSIQFPGEIGRARFPLSGAAGRDFVLSFLERIRDVARGGATPPEPDPTRAAERRAALSVGLQAASRAREVQANLRVFAERFLVTRKAVVAPLLVAACVGVFVLMVAKGVSPTVPDPETMLGWGALFGPSVLVDGQTWRLASCVFLHYGFLHLAMNMIGLASAGSSVERMFGRAPFALLYGASGVCGGLASLWYHPLAISAGASGAIFGVFGALIGLLAVRRDEAPMTVFRPMAKGLSTFLLYNLVLGLAIKEIDMAAHVGGLLCGVACGFVYGLAGRAAPRARQAAGAAAILVVAAGIAVLAPKALASARSRLMADPEYARVRSAPEFNDFATAVHPLLGEVDRIQLDRRRLAVAGDLPASSATELDSLVARAEELGAKLRAAPAANADLVAMRDRLSSLAKHQKAGLERLAAYARSRDASKLEGPGGLAESDKGMQADIDAYVQLKDQYVKKNDLKPK